MPTSPTSTTPASSSPASATSTALRSDPSSSGTATRPSLYVLATYVDITWTLVGQAAQGAREAHLIDVVARCDGETTTQVSWLRTRLKQAAPQALLVAR